MYVMGFAPGDKMKMRGVRGEEAAKADLRSNGGGFVNCAPNATLTKSLMLATTRSRRNILITSRRWKGVHCSE
jgi:hypothetical protein